MSSLDLQEPKQEKQAPKGGVPKKVDPAKVGALQNLTRSDADLLSRSVVLEETDPPGGLRATVMTVSVVVLIFVAWAILSKFPEYAVAEGEIIPVDEAQEVQHLEGGTIAWLGCLEWENPEAPVEERVCLKHVEEASEVRAGDILLKIDDRAVRAERDALSARVASLGAQAERLKAFTSNRQPDFAPWAGYPEIVASHQDAYDTASTNRRALISGLTAQINARNEEVNGLRADLDSLEKQTAAVAEELEMRRGLLEQGHNSRVVVLNVQRQHDKLAGDVSRTRSDISRATASLAEARSRRIELTDELAKTANEELAATEADLEFQTNRLEIVQDQLDRTTVRAPVSGRVSGMMFNKPGIVVSPAAILMSVVPQQTEFLADIRIPAADIGHVEVGMDALIKVTTYKFGRKGGLTGKVTRISPDSFEDELDGERYFRARVAIDGMHVGGDPGSPVATGMTVHVSIKTGEKSLMAYLLRPLTTSFDDAFSER